MVTNFFPVSFPFTEFDIQQLPYTDDGLKSLREQHNAVASFFRKGDSLYISPQKNSGLSLGKVVRLAAAAHVPVLEQMVRHLLFRTFRDAFKDRVPEEFSPLRFPSIKNEHDPLHAMLPPGLAGFIQFPRVTEIHVRSITQGGRPQIGILILNRHRWRFSVPLSTLHAKGFPLVGCSVLETVPLPGLKGVLCPDETVLGEVERVEGDDAVITTNQGLVKRPLTLLLLQRTREQIGRYLEFRLGAGQATKIFRELRDFENQRVKEGAHYQEVLRAAEWFAKQVYENDDGFIFTIAREPADAGNSIRLEPTKLVFDLGPGAADTKPLGGLVKYGPFDSARFDRKSPRILAIFHQQDRGAATQFLAQLINGIPTSKYFKMGFRELFRLHETHYTLKEINARFAEDYEKAVDEAVRDAGGKTFDIALVQCPEDSHAIPVANNPYYRAKARLMSYGIPTQCVREEHLRQGPNGLAWTLGPVSLQMYAKLGGIPWLLPGSQSVDAELIVGIGNTIHRPNLWSAAEQSRIVGLTTFFLGDGRYLMGQELKSVPYEQYFGELLRSLHESLDYVSKEYAWKPGKTVRLVFHVFKPLKNLEVEVVEQLIQRFPQFKILYAFVTVSKQHPWMMYQDAVRGEGGCNLTYCERGANLVLDEHSCLIQMRGERDRPNRQHRPPFPVLLRIHEKSTYKDLAFIAQQVLDFSYLNWRSFYPAELPVTIFYSSLMADISARLQRIKGWNPVLLDQHFRRKAWFL